MATAEIEKHWRVQEVAAQLGVSYQTVIRKFEDLPKVKIMGEQTSTKDRKKYRTILIPDSVLREYLKRIGN